MRNVADALSEAVRLSEREPRDPRIGTAATHWPERGRLSASGANQLRDIAAAAQAFTDDYVNAIRQQAYSFDPEHYPAGIDEL